MDISHTMEQFWKVLVAFVVNFNKRGIFVEGDGEGGDIFGVEKEQVDIAVFEAAAIHGVKVAEVDTINANSVHGVGAEFE